jgi:hypothetical protein
MGRWDNNILQYAIAWDTTRRLPLILWVSQVVDILTGTESYNFSRRIH